MAAWVTRMPYRRSCNSRRFAAVNWRRQFCCLSQHNGGLSLLSGERIGRRRLGSSSSSSSNVQHNAPTSDDIQTLWQCMDSRPESLLQGEGPTDTKIFKYNQDWTKHYQGQSSIVLRPKTTLEISKILKYCHGRRIGVVPQGGNTGLVGGSVSRNPKEIVLSLDRLQSDEELLPVVDPSTGILKASAGSILQELQDFAASHDFLVPVDLGAKGSCQIGGNLSTNAGGSYYYRYGSLHANTIGLEVVLANGDVLNLGFNQPHLKDNTGYDLKHLFIGAEGTLGIITKVALLCPPLPKSKCAAMLACESYEHVYHTLSLAKSELGEILAAFEFMDQAILEVVLDDPMLQGSPTSLPFSALSPYTILLETHGSQATHDMEKVQNFVETAFVDGLVMDGAMAQNERQVQDFWKIRESCNPSVAALGYVYKYDVSLSILDFDDFIQDIRRRVYQEKQFEDAIVTNWGHVIDGNLHLNVVIPDKYERDDVLYQFLEDIVLQGIIDRGGSISAEHGLGQYKNKHMPKIKDATTLETMKQLKQLFDPHGILNPGKLLP